MEPIPRGGCLPPDDDDTRNHMFDTWNKWYSPTLFPYQSFPRYVCVCVPWHSWRMQSKSHQLSAYQTKHIVNERSCKPYPPSKWKQSQLETLWQTMSNERRFGMIRFHTLSTFYVLQQVNFIKQSGLLVDNNCKSFVLNGKTPASNFATIRNVTNMLAVIESSNENQLKTGGIKACISRGIFLP